MFPPNVPPHGHWRPSDEADRCQAAHPDTPGKHANEHGLYLEVGPVGGRHWRMTYRHAGKEKRLSFCVYPEVTLKAARERQG